LNIEHPTSNIEMKSEQRPYDLDERLLNYGASIINLTRVMTSDYAGRHVLDENDQLIRIFVTSIATSEARKK
jgi:hypothetical protein